MLKLIKLISQLIFPQTCLYCHRVLIKQERTLCIKCCLEIPKQKKICTLNVDGNGFLVYSLYTFHKKGMVQKLVHLLKYKQIKEVGEFFGEEMRIRFNIFENVKYVIPVPIHWKKKKIRGYNQSEVIANAFIKETSKRLLNNTIIRKINNPSQTKKKRFDRFNEIENVFVLKEMKKLENEHIILMDDIMTTGATLSACIKLLRTIPNIRISIVCVAN